MYGQDRNTNNMATAIGVSLAVMLSFIVPAIFSLLFGDGGMKIEDLSVLGVILIAAPVLLMVKAYYSESLKNPQHPFFTQKFRKIKIVIFNVVLFTILLALGRQFA